MVLVDHQILIMQWIIWLTYTIGFYLSLKYFTNSNVENDVRCESFILF